MQDKEQAQVPYFVFESVEARAERLTKRLVIALILSIILIFASNLAWLYVWQQYDTISYDQDGEGINNVNLGLQGGLYNGTEGESEEAERR
jgi:hypothetical protein